APADLRSGSRRLHLDPAALVLVHAHLPAAPLAHAAPDRAVALRHLLGDEGSGAARTRLGDRLVPRHERAVGIAVAAVEGVATARPALVQLSPPADEALDARRHRLEERLDVLALRIPGAAEELAEAAEADLHGPAALLARLVGDLGLGGPGLSLLVTPGGGGVAALRVAAAGQ